MLLYKSMVHLLKHCVQFQSLHFKKDVTELEEMQENAT